MNCWKTISFTKQYGSQRLFILSSLTALFTFILLYIPVTYLFISISLYDNYFIVFVTGVLLMYPTHKLFHYLPICFLNKKIIKDIRLGTWHLPVIEIRVNEPIPKSLFLLALLTPFLSVNALLIIGCFTMPHYLHYFTILLAIHTGLCVSDFLAVKNVLFAPKHSLIEENEDGFEILVRKALP